ncbi:MAG: hypothetical protein R2694_09705 [Ilumatobacteraceae bacterium]|nr:hypothetical protein [Ilumatobacter sp.]MCB9381968.1 hypothetical protein [Acidimicrobiaceae bacterium]MCO5329949.1 hypothetical protein [Ilumatobacteraceae bacterium]
MIAMENAAYVVGSYVVTLGGIAAYAWVVLARARRAARQVPREDRPWT